MKAMGVRKRNAFSRTRNSFASGMLVRNGIPIARSNILSNNSSTSSGFIKIPNRTMSSYLASLKECKSYEMFDLVQNIVRLITDYLNNQYEDLNNDTIYTDDEEVTKLMNELVKNIGFNTIFKDSTWEVVYYGSKGFFISKLGKKTNNSDSYKLKLLPLAHPYSTISVTEVSRNEEGSYTSKSMYAIAESGDQKLLNKNSLLIIGKHDFKLEGYTESTNGRAHNPYTPFNNDDILPELLERQSIQGAIPLFYSVLSDIKNYIIYKTLSSVLAVKDAVIPTFLKLGIDLTKATSTDGINETVNQIETKINESIDSSLIIGESLQIDQLINSIFSNVRVLPDPGNLLSSLDSINLDPLKEKFDQIEQKIEESKKIIFESLGIPEDLFDGGSNQYEVFTRNQRYQSTILSWTKKLDDCYKANVIKLFRIAYPTIYKKKKNVIENCVCKIFKPSPIELDNETEIFNKNKDLAESLSSLIEAYSRLMSDNDIVNNEECLKLLKRATLSFGNKYENIVVDELPKDMDDGDADEF